MIVLGMVLLVAGALTAVAEAHYPAHGVAGGIGAIVMAVGAVLAVSGLGAGILVGLLAGLLLAGAGGGLVMLSVRNGIAVRSRRVRGGAEGLVGHVGTVRRWRDSDGSVALDGALWQACRSVPLFDDEEPEAELHAGDKVVVERVSGLTLAVRPAEKWEVLR